ncbi:MAG: hypothetical protein K2H22_02045 [Muribaculaceae bacterium]|nr:hypothetical protein [Muribaculaceae bacterium]
MKNFALLLSSLAVASSAFAVNPEVKGLAKVSGSAVEPVRMSATAHKDGKVLSEKNVTKGRRVVSPMSKAEELGVSYQEPAGIFALGLTEELRGFNGFSYRKGPAYTPLTWKNTSVGATEFEWEVIKDFQTGETEIFKTVDFEHTETWSLVDGPVLYGMDAAGNAAVFQFGAENITPEELDDPRVGYYFGGDCRLPRQEEYDFGMSTYMYSQNESQYTTFGIMGYNPKEKEYYNPATGLDYIFTDPEEDRGLGMVDPQFEGYANFFAAPAAPYYITKMWSWLNIQANKATNIEMTLYKVDEEGFVTDEILAAGEAAVDKSSKPQSIVVTFDLYALDEDGLQTDEPIVVDCAFLAVMKLNKADLEQVNAVCGGGAIAPVDSDISYPRHAYIVVSEDGEEYFQASPYRYYTDETYSELMSVTDFMWMVDAVFPWTYAVDGQNTVQVPEEGGTASFNISSYYGIEYFGYSFPEDCDWIDFANASVANNQDLQCQVLNIPVAALPEGVEGRSVTIDVEGVGTSLQLVINQGKVNAVSVVAVDKNAVYYDLAGRRVANPEKGIFIRKTGNKAEKVIL